MKDVMLNIGCGTHLIPGFVNIDTVRAADKRYDVTKGVPYPDNTVDYIFSEHFFEHISQRQGLIFLRECRRVLKPGGIVRIAMPDLDDLVERYSGVDWRADGDMFRLGFDWVDNRCEMLNIAMREWGHRWLYNEEELRRVGELTGLVVRGRMEWGVSDVPALSGLEYRDGSKLIMEFSKRMAPISEGLPKISVLIPAYNPVYFEEALGSALAQDYPDLEVVVCDDCETDEIRHIVDNYSKNDARINYFKNADKKGPLFNYVECVRNASGEYIQFLNDDDLLGEGSLKKGADVLSRFADVSLVVLDREYVDDEGERINKNLNIERLTCKSSIIEGRTAIRYLLSMGVNYIGEPSACMFRRNEVVFLRPHIMSIGGVVVRGLGDFVMWCNLLSQGDMAYLRSEKCYIRLHASQWRNNPSLKSIAINKWLKIRKHSYRLGLYEGFLGARGLPDLIVFLKGIKRKPLDGGESWEVPLPRVSHFVVFMWRAVREFWFQYKRVASRESVDT